MELISRETHDRWVCCQCISVASSSKPCQSFVDKKADKKPFGCLFSHGDLKPNWRKENGE